MPDAVTFVYSVFGLVLECNFAIKILKPIKPTSNHIDVRICFGASPYAEGEVTEELYYVSVYESSSGTPGLRIWRSPIGNYLRMQYFDGVQFWVDRQGTALWAAWPTSSSLEDALSYLLGPVLGILLRLRGTVCLHASAVVIEDRVIAFAGAEGAGKSTTAAALAARGYGVVSDDVVALTEHKRIFHVLPAYPYLRLWPDSVQTLYGSADALPRLAPGWEKRGLGAGNSVRFEGRILPLGIIYVFGAGDAEPVSRIDQVNGPWRLLSLAANTFASKILDQHDRAEEFAVLARLVAEVPIRRICLGRDRGRLNEFCDLICGDFESISSSAKRAASHPF